MTRSYPYLDIARAAGMVAMTTSELRGADERGELEGVVTVMCGRHRRWMAESLWFWHRNNHTAPASNAEAFAYAAIDPLPEIDMGNRAQFVGGYR